MPLTNQQRRVIQLLQDRDRLTRQDFNSVGIRIQIVQSLVRCGLVKRNVLTAASLWRGPLSVYTLTAKPEVIEGGR